MIGGSGRTITSIVVGCPLLTVVLSWRTGVSSRTRSVHTEVAPCWLAGGPSLATTDAIDCPFKPEKSDWMVCT